jgi:chromate reductase
MPDNSELEILDLSKLPFFNEDVEAEGIPSVVSEFIDKLLQADGFLISTPEYNYSIPPVLKNAIDWASRDERMPFKDKWVALMSASMGGLGGARAQYHLTSSWNIS